MTLGWGTVVENAVHQCIVAASQLPAESVIWSNQSGPTPETPYIEISRATVTSTGPDWVATEPNPTPSPGAEALYIARGHRTAVLYVQCFGDPVGDTGTYAILNRLVRRLRLPSVRDPLSAAGVGMGSVGTVQTIGGSLNVSDFESRSVLNVNVHFASEESETGTIIETVAITNEV